MQLADTKRNEYESSIRTGGDTGDRVKGSWESTLKFGTEAVKQRVTLALDAEREQFQNLDPSDSASRASGIRTIWGWSASTMRW